MLVLGLLGAVVLTATLPLRAAEAYPATDGQPITVIGGVKRIEAESFLRRYGLDVAWPEPGRRAVFSSAWTKLEIEADKREITLNGLRLFLGDAVAAQGGKLYLSRVDLEVLVGPILRSATYASTRREPRTIVIDAGHGGKDGGTRNSKLKLNEKAMALDVAQRLEALLEREGYKVIMSRSDDTFVDLEERAIHANKAKADLFVSIHFNAVVEGSPVKGTETYIMTPQYQRSTSSGETDAGDKIGYPGNATDAWNAILGYQIHRQLLDELQTVDRGLKRARFVVLKLIDCPAVLVEAGYVSNEGEARKIATPAYRQKIAEALATGVARYAAQVRAAATP
mgnify:CR=1 FL=1